MAAAALYLLYPSIPMIFMGEEFASESPFLFFVDFKDPWVRDAVEKGRAGEFPELSKKLGGLSPLDDDAFYRSKLAARADGDMEVWRWYQSLISLRKELRQSGVIDQAKLKITCEPEVGLFQLVYGMADKADLFVAIRLGEKKEQSATTIEIGGQGELVMDSSGATEAAGSDDEKTWHIGVNQAVVFRQFRFGK